MNHECSAKVHFIRPAQRNVVSTDETSWSPFKTASSPITVAAACQSILKRETSQPSSPELLVTEDINDVCTESVAQCILNVSVSAKNIINSLSTNNCSPSYHPEHLLLITDDLDGLSVHHSWADDSDFSSLGDPVFILHRFADFSTGLNCL